MKRTRSTAVALTVALCLAGPALTAACGPGEQPAEGPDAEWRGTIETDGDVTTVRTEGGSVWGGTARLVEDLSIGRETGESPYLLGDVEGIAAHEDRIFVLDRDVPAVRVYDAAGSHLHDIGRLGEGPGEFVRPIGLAVGADDRVYVHARTRIEVYRADGTYIDTWDADWARVLGDFTMSLIGPGALALSQYLPDQDEPMFWRREVGVRALREGKADEEIRPVPDLGFETARIEQDFKGGGTMAMVPPFEPELTWNVDRSGNLLVARGDRYEVRRHHPDGSRLVASRYSDPVPVGQDEAAWYQRRLRFQTQREGAGPVRGYDVDAGLPDHKPAVDVLIPDQDGRIWVVRPGPGERLPGCAEDASDARTMNDAPCWRDTWLLDVFDSDGRYLGPVEVPDVFLNKQYRQFEPEPYIRGDMMLAVVEDEMGTIQVKRFRLVVDGRPIDEL